MTFKQQVVATLIGAGSGFIFSLFLFYVTEWIKKQIQKCNIEKNIVKECRYNNLHLKRAISDLNTSIEAVGTDKKDKTSLLALLHQEKKTLEAFLIANSKLEKIFS